MIPVHQLFVSADEGQPLAPRGSIGFETCDDVVHQAFYLFEGTYSALLFEGEGLGQCLRHEGVDCVEALRHLAPFLSKRHVEPSDDLLEVY